MLATYSKVHSFLNWHLFSPNFAKTIFFPNSFCNFYYHRYLWECTLFITCNTHLCACSMPSSYEMVVGAGSSFTKTFALCLNDMTKMVYYKVFRKKKKCGRTHQVFRLIPCLETSCFFRNFTATFLRWDEHSSKTCWVKRR